MIEWILSGLVSLLAWLWNSAMTMYYLAGFLVVMGGLVIFVGSVIHHVWKLAHEQRPHVSPSAPVTVHVENLNVTVEMTEPELRRLLAERNLAALPPGDEDDQEVDEYE